MPTNLGVSLQTVHRRRLVIERLTDKAQDDLQNAISCLNVSADSDRAEYLIECAEYYMKCCLGKMKLAKVATGLTVDSSVSLVNDEILL